jgi:predicted transcriptional regulator of viral defense system
MNNLTRYIISTFGGEAVRGASIENACKRFEADPKYIINYMTAYGYLIRIVKGIYYVKTSDEFSSKKAVDVHKVISLGLDELGVSWYFGLNTALRMNGATHEYSDTVFVLNDRIYRNKEVRITKARVKFIKISPKLVGFGVVAENGVRYSDLEKTLLDMIYLSKYRSVPEGKIALTVEEYAKGADHEKVRDYVKAYPLNVGKVAKNAGLA